MSLVGSVGVESLSYGWLPLSVCHEGGPIVQGGVASLLHGTCVPAASRVGGLPLHAATQSREAWSC
jgi:hypothetical protein